MKVYVLKLQKSIGLWGVRADLPQMGRACPFFPMIQGFCHQILESTLKEGLENLRQICVC